MNRNTWIGLLAAALCLTFVFLTQAEEKTTNPEVDALLKTTMDIHDEAMREMAVMNRFGRQLKEQAAQANTESSRLEAIQTAIQDIKKAEEDMYEWMQQYEQPTDLPAEEALEYLKDQKSRISKNQQDILTAKETAKVLLEQ